jgi:F-box protein 45
MHWAGFSKGRHAWEVIWEGPLGTVAVVGIATRRAEMRAQGYVPLLGQDENSWGWNLVENSLLHAGDSHGNFPLTSNAPRYQVRIQKYFVHTYMTHFVI